MIAQVSMKAVIHGDDPETSQEFELIGDLAKDRGTILREVGKIWEQIGNVNVNVDIEMFIEIARGVTITLVGIIPGQDSEVNLTLEAIIQGASCIARKELE